MNWPRFTQPPGPTRPDPTQPGPIQPGPIQPVSPREHTLFSGLDIPQPAKAERRPRHPAPRPGSLFRVGGLWLTVALAGTAPLVGCGPQSKAADAGEELGHQEAIERLAAELVRMTSRRWAGPRTEAPGPRVRPRTTFALDSLRLPLRVHATEGVDARRVAEVLAALERVVDFVDAMHWRPPYWDGDLGGSASFDLYLAPTEALAEAHSDGRLLWTYLDAVSSYAVLDPEVEHLNACVASAYLDALTMQLDPAEAPQWRRATGAWLAWEWTGRFGCTDAGAAQQQESWRSWIQGAADHGAGGGVMLSMLSAVHGESTGVFIRELWQLTRQRTWEGVDLRASPDLWESLDRTLDVAGDRLPSMIEDMAVARYFLGPDREDNRHYRVLGGLGPDYAVPIAFETGLADLPHHSRASTELQTYGSAYALVDVRGAPPQSRLRVWLRGEYGVEWALTGSRLIGGEEKARLSAPPRRADPRSYLPVELTEDTEYVLVTITNLSHRLADADDPSPNARAFRLIFDVVQDPQNKAEDEPPQPRGE